MPFELDDDRKPKYKEDEYEVEWQNSDDTAKLLHDFAHRNQPGRFKDAGGAGQVTLASADLLKALK